MFHHPIALHKRCSSEGRMLLLSPARTPANICQHLFSSSSVTQAFAPSGSQAEAQFAPLGIHFSTMPLASTAPLHPPHPIASSSRRHPDAWFSSRAEAQFAPQPTRFPSSHVLWVDGLHGANTTRGYFTAFA